ncbi:MAG: 16S rRNA (guanine(527)-N(7))-methyltransferase RsmG [Pseudomonadota bacterium]
MVLLKDQFKEFGNGLPAVSPTEVEKYEDYFSILRSWNERMALVSKKSIDLSFATHFCDSLFISDFGKKFVKGNKVYDLGSGAGFPGLVFAIRNPELQICLYEKLLKKQTFLGAVAGQLQLKNVEIQGSMPEQKHGGLILARAVMPPAELFQFMLKRMADGAVLVVNIGSQAEEPKAPNKFKKLEELKYTLPLDCGDRRAIAYQFVPRET